MRSAKLTALAALMAILPNGRAGAAPPVLATIKPIHSLVAAVMKGAGSPELLIAGAQSEHDYALKPSDASKIRRARIVFEVGPDLETYLTRPLASLGSPQRLVVLERAPGVQLLPARHGGLWEDGSDSGEGQNDPHVWLDPENAVAMTRQIAAAMTAADPANAALYASNRDREVSDLIALEAALKRQLAPLGGVKYLVFHDAYRYFEHRFGLTPAGTVTVAPDRPVGARRIEMLRGAILEGEISCVFREPQFSPHLIDTLIEGTRARAGVLDPLGAGLAPGPGLYPSLLRALGGSLLSCLGSSSRNR